MIICKLEAVHPRGWGSADKHSSCACSSTRSQDEKICKL